MKKIRYLIVILAALFAFYEQSKAIPNVWILAGSFAVLMLGLLFLSQKTTYNSFDSDKSKLNDTGDEDRG